MTDDERRELSAALSEELQTWLTEVRHTREERKVVEQAVAITAAYGKILYPNE